MLRLSGSCRRVEVYVQVHDPLLQKGQKCPYELLARVEPSTSAVLRARVLRTGIPLRGTIRAGVPERFVWSTVISQNGRNEVSDLVTLRVASLSHSVDVYASRLQPGRGFPQQPPPGEQLPPGVFKLQPYDGDPNILYLRLGALSKLL